MRWTKQRPKKAGTYLRNNPAVLQWVKLCVVEHPVTKELVFCNQEGGLTPVSQLHESFWYFGPIPKTPGSKRRS